MPESELNATPEHNEWSHFIKSEQIDINPVSITVRPDTEETKAVCKRLGIFDIKSLEAHIVLQRNKITKNIEIKGKITADILQFCVITTEPVAGHIDDQFEAWFAEPSEAVSLAKVKRERLSLAEKNEQPILEEYDDPEPVVDGKIDLGELITQHLSLLLNPYPRAEDVEYKNQEKDLGVNEEMYNNPFAALKEWKAGEKDRKK